MIADFDYMNVIDAENIYHDNVEKQVFLFSYNKSANLYRLPIDIHVTSVVFNDHNVKRLEPFELTDMLMKFVVFPSA